MAFTRQRYETYLQRQPRRYGGFQGGFVNRGMGNSLGRGGGSYGSGEQGCFWGRSMLVTWGRICA
jgi:hypothetical protein